MALLIAALAEKLLEALLSVIIAQIISIYRSRKRRERLITMSWGGLLIAIGAAASSYLPHVDPHYTTLFAALGALAASFGESLLGPKE